MYKVLELKVVQVKTAMVQEQALVWEANGEGSIMLWLNYSHLPTSSLIPKSCGGGSGSEVHS